MMSTEKVSFQVDFSLPPACLPASHVLHPNLLPTGKEVFVFIYLGYLLLFGVVHFFPLYPFSLFITGLDTYKQEMWQKVINWKKG